MFKAPQGFWLITRYEDTAFVLRDKRFGKDFVGNMERRYGGSAGMNEPAIASLARTMLVLDTAGLEAERLYVRSGWQRVGAIPGYAMWPHGGLCDTTFFWKRI